MKHSFLCLAFLLLTATCVFSQTTKDSTWIEQFKIFRDGIYHHDKETVKQFFDFPIKGDYCWSYARMNIANDDKATDNALQKLEKNISPLTEKLFALYFDQIFSKEFISSLIKIKTKELYQKGEIETPELSADKVYAYKIIAKFETESKILTLNFLIYPKIKSTDDDSPSGSKWENIMMQFSFITGKLKFMTLSMAG